MDGQGHRAMGTVVRMAPSIGIEIVSLDVLSALPPVHLLVPIADKDRMLWLAEKVAELGVTTWRPVLYRRSKSVKPRGEGPTFNGRVKTRMGAALEQSGGRWLPAVYPESTLDRTLAALPQEGSRLLLDPSGRGLLGAAAIAPVTIAVGPEGGFEPEEVDTLEVAGFERVAVGGGILRFETAAVAAVAIVRASLHEQRTHA
jgi:16S rRNA (uracil1498-N3)-methyltransferase